MWVSRGTAFAADGIAVAKTLRNGKEASEAGLVGLKGGACSDTLPFTPG